MWKELVAARFSENPVRQRKPTKVLPIQHGVYRIKQDDGHYAPHFSFQFPVHADTAAEAIEWAAEELGGHDPAFPPFTAAHKRRKNQRGKERGRCRKGR